MGNETTVFIASIEALKKRDKIVKRVEKDHETLEKAWKTGIKSRFENGYYIRMRQKILWSGSKWKEANWKI